ncbi:hypothetical protein LRP88_03608 [Fusarium phalaenopsidis]
MKVIAVAGGTGHVGRTIVETLTQSPSFRIIVLGRKATPSNPGEPVHVAVDYANVAAVATTLEQHNVHTVISAIQVANEEASAAEANLIKAAGQSSSVKRFILTTVRSPTSVFQKASLDALRKTGLEWTRFAVGYFLDCYSLTSLKTHLPPLSFAIDVANKKAAIPGTGNEPIALTYTYDVAKFVAAFLEEPKWEELTFCYGEKTTWNEFVMVAEEVIGSSFDVTYDPLEKLQRGETTELPAQKAELALSPFPEALTRQLLALLGIWSVTGQFDIPHDGSLNTRYPGIKPVTIREALQDGRGR